MSKLYLMGPEKIGIIKPEIYGHFSEHIGGVIYDGIWVGKNSEIPNIHGFRKDIVEKLKAINPPVLRWPGGCFAETYDWRDGIGNNRPIRINWWNQCDGRYETNEVGTHEFIDFCRLIGAKPYFAANIATTTPLDIRNWIDYCNSPTGTTTLAKDREANGDAEKFDVKFWGIGNENWGGGGNMTPETYCVEYRKYSIAINNGKDPLTFIACGPNGEDYNWTQKFLEKMYDSAKIINGLSLHYYCGSAGDVLNFTKDEWYKMLEQADKMESIIKRHWSIIQGYGMEERCPLVIDEWGCWHPDGSGPTKGYNLFEQQSTMRDAMVATLTLNIFNNNCDKILMANIAQLVNNLHALFLAHKENCITTPTYHVFDMFKVHMGATAIKTVSQSGCIDGTKLKKLSCSASIKDGFINVSLANLSASDDELISLEPIGFKISKNAEETILNHEDYHAHNSFDNPQNVRCEYMLCDTTHIIIPKASIVTVCAKIE